MANAKRPVIAIDLDGVVANFSAKFLSVANTMFELNCKQEDQTSWDFRDCQPITKYQEDTVFKTLMNTDNWWLSLDPLPETDALRELEHKYQIYFITARFNSAGLPMTDQAAIWLRREFFITNPCVIACKHKGPLLAALNVEYFIDDNVPNIADARVSSPFTKCYIQDQPYNREYEQGSVTRVKSLNEFFAQIEGGINGSCR
jgi:5'(3')-deoxyribonucleotidase